MLHILNIGCMFVSNLKFIDMKTRLESILDYLDYYNTQRTLAVSRGKYEDSNHYASRIIKIHMYIAQNYKHKNSQYE